MDLYYNTLTIKDSDVFKHHKTLYTFKSAREVCNERELEKNQMKNSENRKLR